ncbi:MAG: pyroglutamyl-peptidase I [Clostridia bacterium]|nr:pyroglutamyl-peptidase I [Clostridia bacterium]
MKKLLITGFEPFGGEEINPSWEAVSRLPDTLGGYALTRLLLPVVFGEAAQKVIAAAEGIDPDVILCVGQAGGRDQITPELVAINLRHARIADNSGAQPQDERIMESAPDAYFSTLPVRKMAEAISALGIKAGLSYSAGAYVCNDLLYTLLARFRGKKTRVGFIHVPYTKEQGKEPCMEMDSILAGLCAAIESMDAQ